MRKCGKEWQKLLQWLKEQLEDFGNSKLNMKNKALHLECLARSTVSLSE
jgi:hypothetical protein